MQKLQEEARQKRRENFPDEDLNAEPQFANDGLKKMYDEMLDKVKDPATASEIPLLETVDEINEKPSQSVGVEDGLTRPPVRSFQAISVSGSRVESQQPQEKKQEQDEIKDERESETFPQRLDVCEEDDDPLSLRSMLRRRPQAKQACQPSIVELPDEPEEISTPVPQIVEISSMEEDVEQLELNEDEQIRAGKNQEGNVKEAWGE